ncbi:MAG: peptidoglycan-binding protein [Burkholderiales bacterium]|nr:peptidoglycan-binding protein [Burkholderiales bacterium]
MTISCAGFAQRMEMGAESAKTTATGSAGGASAENVNAQLEHCNEPMGTVALVEDQNAHWYHYLSHDLRLGSTTPVLKLLVQQSNCFVVVERGRAMNNMMQERSLEDSGELRKGSKFHKGQMVSADYSLSPSVTFSSNDTGGIGGAVGGLLGGRLGGLVGAVAGNMKFKEASTLLTMVDNRSGVQLAAAEGSAKNTDFGAVGALFAGAGGGGLDGYTKTPEGKVIVAAFTDSYNNMVRAVRNYTAQEVKGGLGTGGRLKVQGAEEAEAQQISDTEPPAKRRKK